MLTDIWFHKKISEETHWLFLIIYTFNKNEKKKIDKTYTII
jgi:hypothetical protein